MISALLCVLSGVPVSSTLPGYRSGYFLTTGSTHEASDARRGNDDHANLITHAAPQKFRENNNRKKENITINIRRSKSLLT